MHVRDGGFRPREHRRAADRQPVRPAHHGRVEGGRAGRLRARGERVRRGRRRPVAARRKLGIIKAAADIEALARSGRRRASRVTFVPALSEPRRSPLGSLCAGPRLRPHPRLEPPGHLARATLEGIALEVRAICSAPWRTISASPWARCGSTAARPPRSLHPVPGGRGRGGHRAPRRAPGRPPAAPPCSPAWAWGFFATLEEAAGMSRPDHPASRSGRAPTRAPTTGGAGPTRSPARAAHVPAR